MGNVCQAVGAVHAKALRQARAGEVRGEREGGVVCHTFVQACPPRVVVVPTRVCIRQVPVLGHSAE